MKGSAFAEVWGVLERFSILLARNALRPTGISLLLSCLPPEEGHDFPLCGLKRDDKDEGNKAGGGDGDRVQKD